MKTIIRLILMGLVFLLELNSVSALEVVDPTPTPTATVDPSSSPEVAPSVETELSVSPSIEPKEDMNQSIEKELPDSTIVPTDNTDQLEIQESDEDKGEMTSVPEETIDASKSDEHDSMDSPKMESNASLTNVEEIILQSEAEYGMQWQRIEQSEAVFQLLQQLDQGIAPNAIVTGNRVAQYNSPHFGYITQFNFDDSGYVYYCIDPTTLFHDGEGYVGSTITFDKISFENLLKISQIMSFGYGFDGKESVDYFIATQILIWEVLGYYIDDIRLMDGTPIDVSAQKEEILNDIVELRTQPSFHGSTIKCPFNAECIIPDGNHVLSQYYEIDPEATSKNFAPGYPYIDDENNLHVKFSNLFENAKPVRVKSNAGGYYAAVEAMLLMTKPGSQDLLGGRLPDPIEDAELSIVGDTRDLTVDKTDEFTITALPGTSFQIAYDEKFTHLIVPNCDVGLVSEEDSLAMNINGTCSIYNRDTRKFDTKNAGAYWTVGSDGTLRIDDLLPIDGYSTILNTQPGVYWIREVDAHQGYVVNNITYKIDLNQGNHYRFMNLNRDVDLTVFKQDDLLDKVYLDGANWIIYEIPNKQEVAYNDGLPIGLTSAENSGIPGEDVSDLMTLDYSTLTSILPDYKTGDLFVANDHLYRINAVESDNISVGVTNIDNLARCELTVEMIPSDIKVNDSFSVNDTTYTLRLRRGDDAIVEAEDGLLYIARSLSLKYSDVESWPIGNEQHINDDIFTLVEITPFQAIVNGIYSEESIITEKDSQYRNILLAVETLGLESIEDAIGKTITVDGQEMTIKSIDSENQQSITIDQRYEKSFTIENEHIRQEDLPDTVEQEYEYTMVDVIEPEYKFKAVSEDASVNGMTIDVIVNQDNPWLSFETVDESYPWTTNLISIGNVIEREYTKPLHDPIDFETLKAWFDQGNSTYAVDDQLYTYGETMMDDNGAIVGFTMMDASMNTYVVDTSHPLVGPSTEYSVKWQCIDVKMPAFIARFTQAYDQFFTTYPYQENALIGFSLDHSKQQAATYIDFDTNADGQMIDFHGDDMDLINTHPFDWNDLKALWNIAEGESFTLHKPRNLDINDQFELSYSGKQWNATVISMQQYPFVTTTLLINEIDAMNIANLDYHHFTDGMTIEIDAKDYLWSIRDNADQRYFGTLTSPDNTNHDYYVVDVNVYDSITLDDMQMDANTFDIAIPSDAYPLDYAMIEYQLNQIGIHSGYSGDAPIYVNDDFETITIETYDENHIVFSNQQGKRFTLYALPYGNQLQSVTFIPLNKPIDIGDLYEIKDGQTIVLDAQPVNGKMPGTLNGTILTMSQPASFRLRLIEPTGTLAIEYDRLKDYEIGTSIEIDGTTITIDSIDTQKIVYTDKDQVQWTSFKPTPLDLEKINAINVDIPLILKGIFEYMNHQYMVEAIESDGSTITSITYCDVESKECFINDSATPQIPLFTIVTDIDCLTTVDSNRSSVQKNLYPIFHGISGGVYLRTVDINNHNRPLPHYSVTIYEDPDGLYPVETLRSDAMGVVDVTHLDDGIYYWKMPGVIMMQSFEVKHQQGGLTIENLKYGQTYMACEIEPPTGYMISSSEDICHTFTTDESIGYTAGIDHQSLTVANTKRDIDVTAYKIDQDDARHLLNGALFDVYDVTYEGKDMCEYQTCDDPYIPMVGSRQKIATLLSGGIYIQKTEYRFINPVDYDQLIELVNKPQKGMTFTYDGVNYTINDVWFPDTKDQHILYTDGKREYNGSSQERSIATNYADMPVPYVTYQFSMDADFKDVYYAQTDVQGVIEFIPMLTDEQGESKYHSGLWYYRKVTVSDQSGQIIEDNLENYDIDELVVSEVFETKSRLCNPGRMDLSDIDYDSSLQWCEVKSPLNYLHNPVCETMVLRPTTSFDSVNHYKRNERIIRYRRKKRGYRLVRYQTLRLRAMGDGIETSDCALDWYRPNYIYEGVFHE